jgi:DNA-binding GntR family transcriptional regulator
VATITKQRLADQVYAELVQRILHGTLPPGSRLSVPQLAVDFGISRSPVREAVQRLVAEGMAAERPNHGALVAAVDVADLIDMYEVRAPLDGLAALLATRSGGRDRLADLDRAMALHRSSFETGDVAGIIRADLDFHGAIAATCGNAQLWAVLEPIHRRVALAILAGEPGVWPRDALREHQAIADHIAAGDAEGARRAAHDHIMAARQRLIDKRDRAGSVS